MDVLFGSIDVRNLLATPSLDETSPLSAPDLRLMIDRLQVRSLEIKSRVRDYLLSHRDDFSEIFTRCSNSVSRTDDLFSNISQALELLDQPLDVEIRDLAEEIGSKKREFQERRESLEVVKVISGFLERIRYVKECMRNGMLVEAAEGMRDLKDKAFIGDSTGGSGDEPVVVGLLRDEWARCSDELQEVLAKILESAVCFDVENRILRVNRRPTIGKVEEYELRRVLEALEIVGSLDYGFAKVSDMIVKYVITPVISDESISIAVDYLYNSSDKNHKAVLKLVDSQNSQGNKNDASIYLKLTHIIRFIHKSICYESGNWIFCFGRLTWSRISELVITFFLSKAVPDDASKIASFQDVIKYTAEFEAFLKEIMFISADSKDEKLSIFVHNVEVHFATRKRNAILAKVRDLIIKCDFVLSPKNMSGDGGAENYVELLLEHDRCIISKAAMLLMELVHQTLKDVCISPVRVALELYHAARDALLLYEATTPVKTEKLSYACNMKLEKQMDTISQAALILHNDCIFLSQEIFALTFEYRSDFPVGVKEIAVFTDIAPYFHQLAEEILQNQVKLANLSLKEAIDSANGYQNTHLMQQFELAKFSIDQASFILEKLHILWKSLLPMSKYKRCMCSILDGVFSRLINDILFLDDIAADESLQLQRLINMTLECLSSLIDSLLTQTTEKETSSSPSRLDSSTLPSLSKLRKLSDILDMPLKSITMSWENGDLTSCGFTTTEVINFIKAVFTDSPLRKECILKIESRSH